MRIGITLCVALTVMAASGVMLTWSHGVPMGWTMPEGEPLGSQAEKAGKTYSVDFPNLIAPSDSGIGLVRIVLSCARVAAITRIPDDWYVHTLRPNAQPGPEWSEFQFASNAVEFAAGHGVTRLPRLKLLDGALKIEVVDSSCFDITVDIRDDLGSDWKVRLRKAQLELRN
jgi:hypothetical protein